MQHTAWTSLPLPPLTLHHGPQPPLTYARFWFCSATDTRWGYYQFLPPHPPPHTTKRTVHAAGMLSERIIMPLIWLMDSNGSWLMKRGKRGGDDGMGATGIRGVGIGRGRNRGGWTTPEVFYRSRSTLSSSPPFCCPPLLFTLLPSPPGISLWKIHWQWGLSLSAYMMG